jgi:pyruvate dehydrogenase E1 component alpha subunit
MEETPVCSHQYLIISIFNKTGKTSMLNPMYSLSKETHAELYRKMITIRLFEERVAALFAEGRLHGTAHFCIGEEAADVGICAALEKDDLVSQTHRNHGHGIAKGADIKRMMAELLGKETGYCKGRGGSMHIADFSSGSLGSNGIVGGGIPIAVGAALSQKYLRDIAGEAGTCSGTVRQPAITVSFFGDGATNEGAFHESLNLASVWRLPVLFVCNNNFYAMSTHIKRSMNIRDISLRAASYGIKGVNLDGNDVLAVYDTAKTMRNHVLENGPALLVLNTYRWLGHSKSDSQLYRSVDEVNSWKEKCPIKRFKDYLLEQNILSSAELDSIDTEARARVEEAVAYAEQSPEPPPSRIFEDVYAEGDNENA